MNLQENIERIKEMMDISSQNVKYDAILIGGLDYRKDKKGKLIDKTIDEQVELLKQGFGKDKKIKGFQFNVSSSTLLEFLETNPKVPVFLFSAGCKMAFDISRSPFVDKKKIYIIEPWGLGEITPNIVKNAVKGGVPPRHVFVGISKGTGVGIVDGAVPSGATDHWSALTLVGKMMSTK